MSMDEDQLISLVADEYPYDMGNNEYERAIPPRHFLCARSGAIAVYTVTVATVPPASDYSLADFRRHSIHRSVILDVDIHEQAGDVTEPDDVTALLDRHSKEPATP